MTDGLSSFARLADSATLLGSAEMGRSAYVAQGAVLRGSEQGSGLRIGPGSMVLENCVLWGGAKQGCELGARTVLGHRSLVIGASIGNLCEIGNGAIILEGARLEDGCILGEGALVAQGQVVPAESVVVGRPGRVVRSGDPRDRELIARMRGGDLSLPAGEYRRFGPHPRGQERSMGKLYSYRNQAPKVHPSAYLFESAEITGDVHVGSGSVIGAGVKIIGDSHGPVRIGRDVQILENSVLHLLPDNELVLEDGVIIGPAAMIHGCRIGAGSLVEPGAIVCDNAVLGRGSLVCAGSLVKQRSRFPDFSVLDGFPAKAVETREHAPQKPGWALEREDLATREPFSDQPLPGKPTG